MNNIIKKCIDELNKEDFRRDYVIGMLETLYDLNTEKRGLVNPLISLPVVDTGSDQIAKSIFDSGFNTSYTPSGIKPIVPPVVDEALIRKLRGGATVETISVQPLNAKS